MTRSDAATRARTFLLDMSSDDSWIDASSSFVLTKLTDLLLQIHSNGAKNQKDSVEAHDALGVFPGAYDE